MTATVQPPRTVRVGNSVVTFDGAVIEFFGFMEFDSHRFHVAIVDEIEIADRHLLGTCINVRLRSSASWQGIPNFRSDAERADLEALILEVRAAQGANPR
jgi:hypothetical protein